MIFLGRKFVPNDTYEDHKVTCIQVASSPTQRSEHNESVFSEPYSGGDLSDSHRDPMEDDIGQPQPGKKPNPESPIQLQLDSVLWVYSDFASDKSLIYEGSALAAYFVSIKWQFNSNVSP